MSGQGHLETTISELRQSIERSEAVIEKAPRQLEAAEKALAQTLDLLHALIRPTFWLVVSAMMTLLGGAGYLTWRAYKGPYRPAEIGMPRSPDLSPPSPSRARPAKP
jgi:hypothetical protein